MCIYIYIYIYVYIRIYVIYMYIYVYVYLSIYQFINSSIYLYTWIWLQSFAQPSRRDPLEGQNDASVQLTTQLQIDMFSKWISIEL